MSCLLLDKPDSDFDPYDMQDWEEDGQPVFGVQYNFDYHVDNKGHHRYGYNPEEQSGVTEVELVKKDGCALGLTISGGIDKDERPQISFLRSGSIAHRCDALEVGDYILAVNGIRTSMLKHDEIVNLLKNTSDIVTLEVEYKLPDPPQSTFSVMCKHVDVRLCKDGDSYGFTLRGGVQEDPIKCRPLTVTHIRPGSAADRESTLKLGDRIQAINGLNVANINLTEAINVIKHTTQITLSIEYDVSIMEAVQNATGPLLVEIERLPGTHLGITLAGCTQNGKNFIYIDSIKPASIADRCGALHEGDQLWGIDGTSLEHMTLAEATQLLRYSVGEHIGLEILPHAHVQHKPQTSTNKEVTVPTPAINQPGSVSRATHSFSQSNSGSQATFKATKSRSSTRWPNRENKRSTVSLTASTTASVMPAHQVCRVEVTKVTLYADQKGFGFSLQGGKYPNELLTDPPVLSCIEPHGAADRTGVMQEGGRLLCVNDQSLENLTMDAVNQRLRDAGSRAELEIEFDVAESVIPSSGIFNVKLAKRGAGIGITINCIGSEAPRNRRQGEPLLISDVRKGSVAHRTGTIQPGDKLLAIDHVRTDNCTIQDAANVLQNASEIVKLRIKKDETYSEEPDNKNSITYTVELQRFGGPLGITISGTEETFDPIIISGLTENGLAERTGALHVGDRILAINNMSLQGRPLSDAIEMLQNAGDIVTLKVTRPAYYKHRKRDGTSGSSMQNADEKFGTPIPSVDSALESWDSSGLDSKENGNSKSADATKTNVITAQSKPSPHSNVNRGSTYNDLTAEMHLSDDDWEKCSHSRSNSVHSYTSSIEQDEWIRTLEDLKNAGQTDILDQLEADLGRCSNSSENNSQTSSTRGSKDGRKSVNRQEIHMKQMEEQLQNLFTPTPVHLHRVTLQKTGDTDDFGFSLSDGVYEKGVFISALRPGSPAEKSGILRVYDRILQINNVHTRDLDCCLVVPLIAEAGNQIEVVISRNPLAAQQFMRDLKCHTPHMMDSSANRIQRTV